MTQAMKVTARKLKAQQDAEFGLLTDFSWGDKDVAQALGIAKSQVGVLLRSDRPARPGAVDLRLAGPIFVGLKRRWNPAIIAKLIEEARNAYPCGGADRTACRRAVAPAPASEPAGAAGGGTGANLSRPARADPRAG